ncbi:uncharacterized protein LOC101214484 [Cucumis sativus]|uniref:DUF7851 domain-containing protein n=1 Tax=Cucumis sativus TaxID=3659 RepID=A0A0A0KNW4_CUCSA|nr:uncharacterized protein LOC101214484 [Cucumis sativus]KGN51313.1 hypothetical protein Csa_008834 [Cucumis sativus]
MESTETTKPITTKEKKEVHIEEQEMEETETKKSKKNNKKQKHQHPNDQTTKSDFSFKPCSDVKGLRFGGQFIVKSFTIRRARPLELLRLLSFPATTRNSGHKPPFPSATAFIPTNFTILAHHAWHTLTLGLGTRKSKVLLFVFENETMKAAIDRVWPTEIPLGEVNKKMIRGLSGCEMARFKFRKGCITFYVYAVRREGCFGFSCTDDLRTILESVVALKDFLDHTAMLAMPNQRTISFAVPPVAMAY